MFTEYSYLYYTATVSASKEAYFSWSFKLIFNFDFVSLYYLLSTLSLFFYFHYLLLCRLYDITICRVNNNGVTYCESRYIKFCFLENFSSMSLSCNKVKQLVLPTYQLVLSAFWPFFQRLVRQD